AESSLNLRFAAADARALAALFEKRGGALFGSIKPTVLTDADATTEKVRQAIKDIAAAARPEDVLVVFLAGHGLALGQRYFFIPHEFKRTAGAAAEADVRKQGMAGDVLAEWLSEVRR